ncbi:hypothetical protein DRN67_02130, partial [Candidatus Micrarchaeota archaeon]
IQIMQERQEELAKPESMQDERTLSLTQTSLANHADQKNVLEMLSYELSRPDADQGVVNQLQSHYLKGAVINSAIDASETKAIDPNFLATEQAYMRNVVDSFRDFISSSREEGKKPSEVAASYENYLQSGGEGIGAFVKGEAEENYLKYIEAVEVQETSVFYRELSGYLNDVEQAPERPRTLPAMVFEWEIEPDKVDVVPGRRWFA